MTIDSATAADEREWSTSALRRRRAAGEAEADETETRSLPAKPPFSDDISSLANCQALATQLSQQYRQPATSEESPLHTSGVLLTMCELFDDFCGPKPHQDHIAASWIQHHATGRRAIFFGTMGWLFNRTVADVECIFPTDGATDGRYRQGCGEMSTHVDTWKKRQIKEAITNYKNKVFGPDTPWESIDCRDMTALFPNASSPSPIDDDDDDDDDDYFPAPVTLPPQSIIWNTTDCQDKSNTSAYKFLSLIAAQKGPLENILGHTLCHMRPEDATPNFDDDNQFFIYDGSCAWSPDEWQSMIDTVAYLHTRFPKIFSWTEFVVRKPERHKKDDYSYPNLVSAVFYTHTSTYWRALVEAKALGQKHLLRMRIDDPLVDHGAVDLFQCVVASQGVLAAIASGMVPGLGNDDRSTAKQDA